MTETLALEAPFSRELYHEYTFRVRARDLVGHVSDWITTTVAIVNQTKYYFLDGRRVAMRKGDKIFYLYGDHLGSTSLTTDENGVPTSQDRYLPYGGGRLSDGISPTDFGFTDQRNEVGLGLMDYNARYYDPFLGRFISPDPIVPDQTNPQSLNRYSYVYNNPVKYTDPSGYCAGLCLGIGIALVVAGIFFYNEMPVGEGAPPHTPVENYVKSGTDFVGDTYTLIDEYPDNVVPNSAAILIPGVSGPIIRGVANVVPSQAAVDALAEFGKRADVIQAERGYGSFGSKWWERIGRMARDGKIDPNDLFTYYDANNTMTGAMLLSFDPLNKSVHIDYLEGLGGGAGDSLLRQAIQESMDRGYGGRVTLAPSKQSFGWYAERGGYLILEMDFFIGAKRRLKNY